MELQPVCPAATVVTPPPQGPNRGGPTVICGVMEIANAEAHGRRQGRRRRGDVDPTFRDGDEPGAPGAPNTVQAFCCGTGLVAEVGTINNCSYAACQMWQQHRLGEWERRKRAQGDVHASPEIERAKPVSLPMADA